MAPVMWRSVVALCSLLLGFTGCRLWQAENTSLLQGEEALLQGNYRPAIEFSTAAIRDAARAPEPYLATKAYLLRGESRLRIARSSCNLIPSPLSESPINVVPVIDGASRPEVALHAIEEDLIAALSHLRDEFTDDRLKALQLLGETFELFGKDTDAVARYTLLSSLSSGRDLDLYCLANRRLGWISLKPLLNRGDETFFRAEIQKKLRTAIRHFDSALKACAADSDSLLGKGVALTELGQTAEGFTLLNRANDLASESGELSPIAQLYLAQVIENEQGYQRKALDHLVNAIRNDPERKYYPIYSTVVRSLPRYLPTVSPEFHEITRALLTYRGLEPAYWTDVERLCKQLAADDDFPRRLSFLGLATARVRSGRINDAIESLLQLRNENDFDELMEATIPENAATPELIYARLRILLELGEHERIEEIAKHGVPVDPTSSYYFHIQGVFAMNLFARWNQLVEDKPEFLQNRYIQEHYLLNARRKLARFLERFPDHIGARRCLGEILQMTGDLAAALSHYCDAAVLAPDAAETFQRLVELHGSDELDEELRLRAWKCLKTFSGVAPTLHSYIQSVRRDNLAKAKRSCPGCGADPHSDATVCAVCGTKLPMTKPAARQPTAGTRNQ